MFMNVNNMHAHASAPVGSIARGVAKNKRGQQRSSRSPLAELNRKNRIGSLRVGRLVSKSKISPHESAKENAGGVDQPATGENSLPRPSGEDRNIRSSLRGGRAENAHQHTNTTLHQQGQQERSSVGAAHTRRRRSSGTGSLRDHVHHAAMFFDPEEGLLFPETSKKKFAVSLPGSIVVSRSKEGAHSFPDVAVQAAEDSGSSSSTSGSPPRPTDSVGRGSVGRGGDPEVDGGLEERRADGPLPGNNYDADVDLLHRPLDGLLGSGPAQERFRSGGLGGPFTPDSVTISENVNGTGSPLLLVTHRDENWWNDSVIVGKLTRIARRFFLLYHGPNIFHAWRYHKVDQQSRRKKRKKLCQILARSLHGCVRRYFGCLCDDYLGRLEGRRGEALCQVIKTKALMELAFCWRARCLMQRVFSVFRDIAEFICGPDKHVMYNVEGTRNSWARVSGEGG